MRKLMLSALLGLGALVVNASAPNEAKASWLSEMLNNSQVQINFGSQYPSYLAPAYAPAPAYPVYSPAPAYVPQAYNYYPARVYTPAPVVRVPAYRPAPLPAPQHSNFGPNRYDHDRHDWHDGRNDHDWRR